MRCRLPRAGSWRALATRRLAPALAAAALAFAAGPAGAQTAVPGVRLRLEQPWRFREAGTTAWYPATVPGTVHTDLLANRLIPDPFTGAHEPELQWIEGRDWEYAARFSLPPALARQRHVELVFDGLDTYAHVTLDGRSLLAADNMFRQWRAQLTGTRASGPAAPAAPAGTSSAAPAGLRPAGPASAAGPEHELSIRFRSPIPIEDSLAAAYPQKLPAGNDPHGTRVFTRKAAYHYGWDWGPRYLTSGIWRPVWLHGWTGATLRDAAVEQLALSDTRATLRATASIEADTSLQATVLVRSTGNEFPARSVTRRLARGRNDVALEIEIPAPRRWWPDGLGEQYRYDLVVELRLDGTSVDTLHRRIGLRTIEVVNQPDSIGTSFYFRVNGVSVFMKGANIIPLDHFAPRVDSAKYRRLFEDVRAAHMNMLRVWGGGSYERDLFYDLADEYGILVWQDFMFANGMYPGNTAFIENVRAEAEDQVRRLRHHPSLALWCGNNEMQEGWENWGWQRELEYTPADSAAVLHAYERIFHDVLPGVIEALDPQRFYWPSSPFIGWGHAESLAHGDSHYWGVWWGEEPFEVFRQKLPRFMSEYGFQAYPAESSIARFTPAAERQVGSPVLRAHQKHPRGDELIRTYMARWYPEPRDFSAFVYLSQLLQAEGIGMALEAHRRAMPRTMGTLYWQLNDTWPVVSWSSIDWYGQWKALHWFARRAFAPLLLSPVIEGDVVRVWLVSDLQQPVSGTLTVRTVGFDGRVGFRREVAASARANGSTLALELPLAEVLRGTSAERAVLDVAFESAGASAERRLRYFALPKQLVLPDPRLIVSVRRDAAGWIADVSTRALARAVELTSDGRGRFADNFFDLLPGETRSIRFRSEIPPATPPAVSVRSLADVR